jgi:hypothetical protein
VAGSYGHGNTVPLFSGSKSKLNLPPASGFLLSEFFDPEDGGTVLFRNVGLSPDYTTLQPK